jgi:hypothetical protein
MINNINNNIKIQLIKILYNNKIKILNIVIKYKKKFKIIYHKVT